MEGLFENNKYQKILDTLCDEIKRQLIEKYVE
jgi:hypothetical protein